MKKMFLIRSLSMLLLLCVLLTACLVGCGNDSEGGGETDTAESETSGPVVETVRITVPIAGGDDLHQYVVQVKDMLVAHGYTVELGDDYLKKGETADPDAYEIYIGSVAREEMDSYLGELGAYGWGVKQIGHKLCIAGTCEQFVKNAMMELDASAFADRHDPFGGVNEVTTRYDDLIYLFRDGVPNVKITGDTSDKAIKAAIDALTASLKRLTGASSFSGEVTLEIKRDTNTPNAAYNAVTFEPSEKKIVLSTVDDDGMAVVAERFYESLRLMNNWKETKTLAWPLEYTSLFSVNESLPYVPYHKQGVIVRGNLSDSYTVAIDSLTFEEFEEYVKKIEAAGFVRDYSYQNEYRYDPTIDTINTSTKTHHNTFYTYVNADGAIHVYHIGGTGHVRVIGISHKDYELAKAAMNDKTDGTNDSEFILLDIGGRNTANNPAVEVYQNGMCLAFRLSDGRFIIVDGGMNQAADPDSLEVVRLHNELLKHSPNGKVVIAAWIFTHMHGDHTLVAWKYESLFGKKVEIQRYIYNIPSLEYALSVPNTDLNESWYSGQVYPSVTGMFRRHDSVIARTGMVFNIGNATLEVLHTADDYFPTPLKIFNNSSLIIKLTIEGKSFLITGDLQEDGQKKCVAQNGDILNVNYTQAAHHGYNMLMMFYQYSMAGELEGGRYAIWPRNTGNTFITGNDSNETGRTINWLQKKVGLANNYYAFKGVQTVKLN